MNNDISPLSARIPSSAAGRRFDQTLAELFPDFSRSRLTAWVKSGDVLLDGAVVPPRHIVHGDEVVTLHAQPTRAVELAPEAIALDIRYEDADVLVINKPAGLVVHPGAGQPAGTLQNALLHHDARLAEIPRAGIVHRLDKDTSGLMVVGRTLAAVTILTRAIAARDVQRRYLAIAHGTAASERWTIEAPIGRDLRVRTRMAVVGSGKAARTDVERIAAAHGFAALRCTLHSGRTHQIRVHLAAHGLPLVGDRLYGGAPALGLQRQALHAALLSFQHPRSGDRLTFESPPPGDFAHAWGEVVGAGTS